MFEVIEKMEMNYMQQQRADEDEEDPSEEKQEEEIQSDDPEKEDSEKLKADDASQPDQAPMMDFAGPHMDFAQNLPHLVHRQPQQQPLDAGSRSNSQEEASRLMNTMLCSAPEVERAFCRGADETRAADMAAGVFCQADAEDH